MYANMSGTSWNEDCFTDTEVTPSTADSDPTFT